MDAEIRELAERRADFCKVFRNPRRVLILWTLVDQELCVSEIAVNVGASLQSTSQHLSLMKENKFVCSRQDIDPADLREDVEIMKAPPFLMEAEGATMTLTFYLGEIGTNKTRSPSTGGASAARSTNTEVVMRKIQLLAVFWTLILAVPFTALALVATAYITENLIEISNIIANLSQNIFPKGRDLVFEFEVISMIIALIIILAILFLTLRTNNEEDPQTS